MNKLKYILPVTIFFCLVAAGVEAQDTIILDKIVAKVGGEVIFHSDVEEQMAMMRERRATPAQKSNALSSKASWPRLCWCTMLRSIV